MEILNNSWNDSWVSSLNTEEMWERKLCGCPKCYKSRKHFDSSDWSNSLRRSCKKEEEYELLLKENASKHFEQKDVWNNFKPANEEQIKEWVSWATLDIIKRGIENDAEILRKWEKHVWSPIELERKINNMWSEQKERYFKSDEWKGYKMYGEQQHKLLKKYNRTRLEGVYNELMSHIDKHGQIISERPEKNHIKIIEEKPIEEQKMGRRATRKMLADKNETTQSYTRAEMRRLARGGDEEEEEEE